MKYIKGLRIIGLLGMLTLVTSCSPSPATEVPELAVAVTTAATSTAAPSATPTPPPTRFRFEAVNPLNVARVDELVSVKILVEDGRLEELPHGSFSVYPLDGGPSGEIVSDYFDSSLARWPSGNIKELRLLFVDDFAPDQIKSYEIRFDQPSGVDVSEMKVEELNGDPEGDMIRISEETTDFYIGHELEPLDVEFNGRLVRDLYVRVETPHGWTKVMPLSHIYGNTHRYRDEWSFDICEPIFILSPGLPSSVEVERNRLGARISLMYEWQAQELCPPFVDLGEVRDTERVSSEVILSVYRGMLRVDASVVIVINQTFYNHNGFAMGGVETELQRPRVIFGTENHVMVQGAVWADTEEMTDRPEFMQIQEGAFVFRRGGNRDAWAPFTDITVEESFMDYYVVEGEGGRAVFAYFPAFRELAYLQTRNEGSGEIVALNMIGSGPSVPLNVANPILLSQTHLGSLGGIWAEIYPGTYQYELTALMEVAFGSGFNSEYDDLAKRLGSPLIGELVVEVPIQE